MHLPLERSHERSPLPARPALLRFWGAAYRRYEIPLAEGRGYHVPEFPVPLLSPRFVTGDRGAFLRLNSGLTHFNEIVPLGHDQRGPAPSGFRLDKQFYLGERALSPRGLAEGYSARILPLAEAVRGNELPALLAEGFPRDVEFLRRALLPFLAALDARFLTAFLDEGGRSVGAVSVGVAGGVALVLNAVIRAADRGRHLSPILTDLAQDVALDAGAKEAFFWTEHPFLSRHADLVRHYRIFARR